VRDGDFAQIAAALSAGGFVPNGSRFAVFGGCSGFLVELATTTAWSLPREEIDALFEASLPLPRAHRLRRPAPGHALLIIARRLDAAPADLDKLWPRVRAAGVEDRAAFAFARMHASAWDVEDAVFALEEMYYGRRDRFASRAHAVGETARRRARGLPRPRRPLVVALSGLDGAGKSSHASALRDTLERLDVPAAVVWTPLGQNRTLELIGRPAKLLLSRLRFGPLRPLAERSVSGSVLSNPGEREGTRAGR
jgi:hypothetical protein